MTRRSMTATLLRISALVAVVAIVGAVVGAGPVLAAKGGNGGGKGNGNGGKGDTYAATLAVSPDPVIAGGDLTITGSGFKPDQWIYFSTTCYGSFNVAVDSAGDTSFTRPAPIGAATCTFDAYQSGGKGKHKFSLMATLTFQVVEP